MHAEKQQVSVNTRTLEVIPQENNLAFSDNRPLAIAQAQLLGVIQMKNNKVIQRQKPEDYKPQYGRKMEGYIIEQKIIMFFTKKDSSYFIEACTNKNEYLGEVEINTSEYPTRISLHTISKGFGGLAPFIFVEALRRIQIHFPEVETIYMRPAPGAASKKIIEMLSMVFGTPEIHHFAEYWQIKRKESYKKKKPNRTDPFQWDSEVLREFYLYLKSIVYRHFPGLEVNSPLGRLVDSLQEGEEEEEKGEKEEEEEEEEGIYTPPILQVSPEAYIEAIQNPVDKRMPCPGPEINISGEAIKELLKVDTLGRIIEKMRK